MNHIFFNSLFSKINNHFTFFSANYRKYIWQRLSGWWFHFCFTLVCMIHGLKLLQSSIQSIHMHTHVARCWLSVFLLVYSRLVSCSSVLYQRTLSPYPWTTRYDLENKHMEYLKNQTLFKQLIIFIIDTYHSKENKQCGLQLLQLVWYGFAQQIGSS